MAGSFSVSTKFIANDRVSAAMGKIGSNAQRLGGVMKTAFAVGATALTALGGAAFKFVSEASKIEDATAAFTPLLGGVEKATELVNRLNKEAATTPFQFEGIASVAKQLLPVMNGSIEDTADTFRMLGDTAGGNIQKLDTITRGYTKALLKGKPDMEALNMISEAGVPIFAEMSKNMGITTAQLFEMSRQGKLTNDDLTNAFKRMTAEGGIFFNGMQIASQTLTGKLSTLKDNINLTAGAIGTQLLPVIKPVIDRMIALASKTREWVEANGAIIRQGIVNSIDKMRSVVQKLWRTFQPLVKIFINFGKRLAPVFVNVFNSIQSVFKALVGDSMKLGGAFDFIENQLSFLVDMVKIFAMAIKLVAAILVPIITKIRTLMMDETSKIGAIMRVFSKAFVATMLGPMLVPFLIIKNWNKLKAAFFNITTAIGQFFVNMWNGVMSITMTVVDFFLSVPDMILSAWQTVLNSDTFTKLADIAGGVIDFFTGGEDKEAPNRREAEAKQQIAFTGQLNIAGAPAGSTFTGDTQGAPAIRTSLLGENP